MEKTQSRLGSQERKNGVKLFFMILPFLVYIFMFSYVPLYGWRYAFYKYKPGLDLAKCEYVGWKYFTILFSDAFYRSELIRVMKNTLGMAGIGLATSWLPMMFAIMLTEISSNKFRRVVQTLTTIPNFISWILVYAMAYCMFSPGAGFVNRILIQLGVIDTAVDFLAEPDHVWLKMWLWGTWKGLGWSAVTYLAAIAGIDKQLYEAAVVDGASRLQRIWHVTLPGLIPTFFVLFVISIGNILSSGVEQYMVFDNPFVRPSIEVLDLYVFNMGVGSGQYSYTTAIGAMKTIIAVILMCSANWLSKIIRGSSVF